MSWMDIEVSGDRYEEEQALLRELAEEEYEYDEDAADKEATRGMCDAMEGVARLEAAMEAADAACDAVADIASECPLTQIDSCIALQIVDGLVPVPECWETDCMDYENCQSFEAVAI